ncbi:MAG TPA: hypothetical protein VHD83_28865 [Puia sp.]|nr:hypothetical protein [Puia sp.]
MLTSQEEAFIRYWEENRSRRKKVFRQFLIGIPVGLGFIIPIVIMVLSGWDKQVSSPYEEKSLMMVLMVALLLIVGFTAIFYQKYKWDQYEQRYRELLNKRGGEGN